MEVLYKRDPLDAQDAEAFSAFVQSAEGAHYAQELTWANAATVGRPLVRRYMLFRDRGEIVASAMMLRPQVGPVPTPWGVIERGPVCRRVEDLERVLPALRRAALRRGIVRLSVQPYWADDLSVQASGILERHGFHPLPDMDGPHACTLRWDVGGKSDEEILAGSERSFLRNKLRQAQKHGAVCYQTDENGLPSLAKLQDSMMEKQGRSGKPDAWFRAIAPLFRVGRAAIFHCDYHGDLVASVLVLRHRHQVTFHLGATDQQKLPFKKMLVPLVRAAQWARDVGAKTFDLGGVPEEADTDEKRNAIAQFKFDFSKARVRLVRVHRHDF